MHELQEKYESGIRELAETAVKCGALGFVASHGGNLSMKNSDGTILITPTKVPKEEIVFDDIVVLDASGAILFASPHRKPTGETPMHTLIYRLRPDLSSLIHAHPPILTGFAISGNEILSRPILPEPCIELGPILSIPYAEPVLEKLAECFRSAAGKSNAWLMKNHGITIGCSGTPGRTLGLLRMAEAMAESARTALQTGGVQEIPRPEVENLSRVMTGRGLPVPGDPRRNKPPVSLYFKD